MGCGSSMTLNDNDRLNSNKKSDNFNSNILKEEKDKIRIEDRTVLDEKLGDEEQMTGTPIGNIKTLENYDLIEKFLMKPRTKNYLEKIMQSKYLNDDDDNFVNLFEEIKSEFDELFKRFKCKYTIPKEDFMVDVNSYKLECKISTKKDIDLYLPFFFLEMCLYPKSYVIKSKVESFIFVNSLEFSTSEYSQYRAAVPEYNKTFALYYCTRERSINYIRQVLHHEFFHYVDWTDDLSYDDKEWRRFNKESFEYGKGGAYEREWKPLDPESKGFVSHYSTTAIEEDKAEIFMYLMANPEEALSNKDEIVKKKSNYLFRWLKNYDTLGMGNQRYLGSLIDFRKIHNY